MTPDENKVPLAQSPKTQEELDDEEEMRKASLMNPQDACGKEEDRFSK